MSQNSLIILFLYIFLYYKVLDIAGNPNHVTRTNSDQSIAKDQSEDSANTGPGITKDLKDDIIDFTQQVASAAKEEMKDVRNKVQFSFDLLVR